MGYVAPAYGAYASERLLPAEGGVGRLLCQRLRDIGANIIATVGSAESGCDVVYDSVGKDTFMGSLECLAPRGHLVNFGQASGPMPLAEVGEAHELLESRTVTEPIALIP